MFECMRWVKAEAFGCRESTIHASPVSYSFPPFPLIATSQLVLLVQNPDT